MNSSKTVQSIREAVSLGESTEVVDSGMQRCQGFVVEGAKSLQLILAG